MDQELEAYETCDWKQFMHKLLPNLYEHIKAMIAAICGLWTRLEKAECEIQYLYEGATFMIGETTSGNAYAVAGRGVSFLNVDPSGLSGDLSLTYVAGGLMFGTGSYLFYTEDFTDRSAVVNFDEGEVERISTLRQGNPEWYAENNKPINGGELICEFRVKKSAFPQINRFFDGFGQEAAGGAFQVNIFCFNEGRYAFGQRGSCDVYTGESNATGGDNGHLVPEGWIYIQLRMSYIMIMHGNANGVQYTPRYLFGVRMNRRAIKC